MDSRDVIVVGGGIAGAACAAHLTRSGVEDVVILERDQPGSKASGRAAGFLTPDQFLSTGTHARMHAFLRRYWRDLATETDLVVHTADAYTLARSATGAERLEQLHHASDVDSELIDGDELAARIPDLATDDVEIAFTYPDGAYTDPYRATMTIIGRAEAAGATVEQTTVAGIRPHDDGVVVETTAGTQRAPTVVLAAGAWSKRLARSAGVELPLRPRISQIAMLEPPNGVSLPLVNDPDRSLYYRTEVSGEVLVGGGTGTEELDPEAFTPTAREPFLAEVSEKAPAVAPGLADARVSSSWAGIVSATPDRSPLVGPTDVPGLIACCGFNGEGIMYSPVAGRIVADNVTGDDPPFDPTPFAPDRFGDGVDPDFEIRSAIDW